jgi:hypothetical protein
MGKSTASSFTEKIYRVKMMFFERSGAFPRNGWRAVWFHEGFIMRDLIG